MKNIIKKTIKMSCLVGAIAILAGCMGMCPNQRPQHHKKEMKKAHHVEQYQAYNMSDMTSAKAKMYTRSSRGGESKMGCIKFTDTDNGVKMSVDLKDLRPGVKYTPRIYQCNQCGMDISTCCGHSLVSVDLPTLYIAESGRLEDSYNIRGVSAKQLRNAKIYLERDGGYKAAWGTFGKDM